MAESIESSANNLEFENSNHQLVTKKRKGFGKIVFAIAVIGLILLGCVVFILLYQGEQLLPEALSVKTSSPVTLFSIMTGLFEPLRFNGTWISDDEILLKNDYGNIMFYNVTSKTSKITLHDGALAAMASEIQLSADKKYFLIAYNEQKIYRHSSYFSALIVDIQTQKQHAVTNSRSQPLVLQLIKWAPKGNGFAYVNYNDIYYRPNATTLEEHRITHTGNSSLYNGVCDWVYEEEVFSDTTAMWFSPNADKLAYATFNDDRTDVMSITYFGEPGTMDSQYPKTYNLRYPKPGRINPTVKLSVADLKKDNGQHSHEISFNHLFVIKISERHYKQRLIFQCLLTPPNYYEPDRSESTAYILFRNKDAILTAVTWISNNEICLVVMNRVQNKAVILSCNVSSGHCKEIKHLESKKGWVNMFIPPLFSPDGRNMLFINPWDQGNHLGSYRHVTLHDIQKNITTALTHGKYTVTEILSWDHEHNLVYYLATEENKPTKQQVYRISTAGKGSHKPDCLSCENENHHCGFSSAIFSKKSSYFVQTCAGPDIPIVNLYNKHNKKLLTWEDNSGLRKLLRNVTLPETKFLEFPVAHGMEAQVRLLLPPNMDKSGKTKYPLLVNVYGGPDSNQVFDRYKISWESYMCLNNNIVIAYIDGRGSGLKGDDMLFANYRRLGTAEVEDQINVTRQIQMKFPFIDKKRTGIWGWSYGGYATGMVLATDQYKVFKCGVSVAPVTDWIYYDSIYTERFLGLPTEKDNKIGYATSSLVQKATRLGNKKYLLVHGTLDDNVHYQQSMMLARTLELHDILFKQQSYPDEVHSLSGVRYHFYHTLESFLMECFA